MPTETNKNLTDWKKEPKLSDLKVMLSDASTEHSAHVSKMREWDDVINAEGKYKPKHIPGRSRIQPRIARRQAEWRYSALSEPFLSSDKLFDVAPVTFEDVKAAEQNELLLNWQFRTKINTISFIDNYVRSAVDEGTVMVRTGWEQETIPATDHVPVWEYYPVDDTTPEGEAYLQQIDQLIEFKLSNPRGYNEEAPEELKAAIDYIETSGVPVQAVQVGYKEVKIDKVIKNQPTVQVMDPASVILDPTCKDDIDKALFVIFTLDVSQFELTNSSANYVNLDKIQWEGTKESSDTFVAETSNFTFKDKMKNKQTMYEMWFYHDINDDGQMVPIVASWIGDVLIRLEESPFPDKKLPLVVVPYTPVKRQIYGETDAELLKDNQQIQGALMRGLVDLMAKSANSQTGYAKGSLDFINRRRLENGSDYEFNPINHPSGAIYQHTFPAIPDSALTLMGVLDQQGDSLTGVKSFSGGISGDSYGRVATGIRGALDSAAKREMAILRRLANGLKEIAERIIAMNAEFLTEDEVVRVTNTQFVKINKEDLVGNFDLQVDISTAEVDEQKSQDLSFMLQTLGPNMNPAITFRIMSEIAKLKRMPELANDLKNIDTSPSEADQILEELRIQKEQLEVAKLESEVMWNQARALREQAQAEALTLNATDVATGVAHARDIERMKSQAQGNQNLAITKALLEKLKDGEVSPDIEAAIGFNELSKQLDNQQILGTAQSRSSIIPQNMPEEFDPETDMQGEMSTNIPPEAQF